MEKNKSSCFKVSDTGICPHCKGKELVKNGFIKNKKQPDSADLQSVPVIPIRQPSSFAKNNLSG
ncbi:MAG: hypothetical protein RBT46_06955 [Weeksellaceae bacterium]|nr:hypothetical protein [Weeksellaceae bacterium]